MPIWSILTYWIEIKVFAFPGILHMSPRKWNGKAVQLLCSCKKNVSAVTNYRSTSLCIKFNWNSFKFENCQYSWYNLDIGILTGDDLKLCAVIALLALLFSPFLAHSRITFCVILVKMFNFEGLSICNWCYLHIDICRQDSLQHIHICLCFQISDICLHSNTVPWRKLLWLNNFFIEKLNTDKCDTHLHFLYHIYHIVIVSLKQSHNNNKDVSNCTQLFWSKLITDM